VKDLFFFFVINSEGHKKRKMSVAFGDFRSNNMNDNVDARVRSSVTSRYYFLFEIKTKWFLLSCKKNNFVRIFCLFVFFLVNKQNFISFVNQSSDYDSSKIEFLLFLFENEEKRTHTHIYKNSLSSWVYPVVPIH